MIENREESPYFADLEPTLTELEKSLFSLLGYNRTNSIVKKIIYAVESDSNRLIYSAPFLQKTIARIYSFFR